LLYFQSLLSLLVAEPLHSKDFLQQTLKFSGRIFSVFPFIQKQRISAVFVAVACCSDFLNESVFRIF